MSIYVSLPYFFKKSNSSIMHDTNDDSMPKF